MGNSDDPGMGGRFSFHSLVCEIFRDHGGSSPDAQDQSWKAALAALLAQSSDDPFHLEKIDRAPPESVRKLLFHERIHYWQLITCPLLQYRFILSLEDIGFRIEAMGGRRDLVAAADPLGLSDWGTTKRCLEDVDGWFRVKDRDFASIDFLLPPMMNIISCFPMTDMPLLGLPHPAGEPLPGYGAVLSFGESPEPVLIPFTAQYLLESAARLSETLYEGKPPARPEALSSKNDQVYYGAWEFWRRLHGQKYESDVDLAYAFLASVELALSGDFLATYASNEEKYEQLSIPYRFGKIAYSTIPDPPIRFDGSDPAKAVADYQDRLCLMRGWSSPASTMKRMAVILTRALVWSYGHGLPDDRETDHLVAELHDSFTSDPVANWDGVKRLWEIMDAIECSPTLGSAALRIMIVACVYRIENPGRFALPSVYADSLAADFPLPLIHFDGRHCADIYSAHQHSTRPPLRLDPLDLAHDCLVSLTMEPLRRGVTECGFLDQGMSNACAYVYAGLGCPATGLSEEQASLRSGLGMSPRKCHWSIYSELYNISS